MNCHCGKKAVGRGLCAYHYQLLKRKNQLPPLHQKVCAKCGGKWYCLDMCKSCYDKAGNRCRIREWNANNRSRRNAIKGNSCRKVKREEELLIKKTEAATPKPASAVKPFSIAPCGAEYDPEVCPMRFKAGLLKECRECILFKGGG